MARCDSKGLRSVHWIMGPRTIRGRFWGRPPSRNVRCFIAVPSEPQSINGVRPLESCLVRVGAPAGAPLYAAHPGGDARSGAPSRARRRRAGRHREAWRLDRGTAGRLPRSRRRGSPPTAFKVPLRGVPRRIVHYRSVRGTVWTGTIGKSPLAAAWPATRRTLTAASATRREASASLRSPASRFRRTSLAST